MAITLSTEDKLEYIFHPCASGQIQFRVKAPNDAHIALASGPFEGEPMYEIFIGGWGNSKSVIRKNRTKPDVAEASTPGILSGDEFRGFWIRWGGSLLSVGKEGEPTAFVYYDDPDPFAISHFGICTGWGACGEWMIEGRIPLKTRNELKYAFHPVRSGSVLIEVKAKSNAHIALTQSKGESSPMYEIMLGGWENTASVIRYDRKQPDKVRVNTPNLLSGNEHKRFLISWSEGRITVREKDENGRILMEWQDPNPFAISHVGVRTSWGATGNWKLHFQTKLPQPKNAATAPSAPMQNVALGDHCWCDASGGVIPPGAVEGGKDDEPLYVGRASHMEALIPGKVKPSHSVCYVAWGGEEHGKSDYQVLCGCNPGWVSVSGSNLPPNAIPAGQTESGETLFVGRVEHEGTLTIGKVQPSHGVCYIPFGGAEVAFNDYEVMVSQ